MCKHKHLASTWLRSSLLVVPSSGPLQNAVAVLPSVVHTGLRRHQAAIAADCITGALSSSLGVHDT